MAKKRSTKKKSSTKKTTVKKTAAKKAVKKKATKKETSKAATKKAKKKAAKKKSVKRKATKKKATKKRASKKKTAKKKAAKKASRRKVKKVAADAEASVSPHDPDPRQLTLFPTETSTRPVRKKTVSKKKVVVADEPASTDQPTDQPLAKSAQTVAAAVGADSTLDASASEFAAVDSENQSQSDTPQPSTVVNQLASTELDPNIGAVIEYLMQEGIVRTRIDPDTGNKIYQLSHCYLTRSVLDAERRADHWPIIAREAHEAVIDAGSNPWRVWQALLTPRQQVALLRERLRRGSRFRYAETRQTAFLSLLRLLPYAAMLIAITFAWTLHASNQEAHQNLVDAQAIMTLIGSDSDTPNLDERMALRNLSKSPRAVQMAFIHDMLSVKEKAYKLRNRYPEIVDAICGENGQLLNETQQFIQHECTDEAACKEIAEARQQLLTCLDDHKLEATDQK